LKLESSSITGEAEPHDYFCDEMPPNLTVFEANNIALNGSLCVEGEGQAIGLSGLKIYYI
jgi:sodium/potassium-transporting ATPase subunit alpha